METVDYKKIADAVEYYKRFNYKYIEVPWIIPLDTMLITRPLGARLFSTFAGELVASGEQSFLEIRKKLKPGKYQCVTPCFRDEKIKDKFHKQYFIKNELIWIPEPKDVPYCHLVDKMIAEALPFFKRYSNPTVANVPLDNAHANKDILINGIEVGSYGCRTYGVFTWIYGTGCAEPRLTQSIRNR
jgi:seryl-tRNA synthetase